MSTGHWVCPKCGSPNIYPTGVVVSEVVMRCGNGHVWRMTLTPSTRVGALKVWLITESDLADLEEGRKPTAIPKPAIHKIKELVDSDSLPQAEYVRIYETRKAAYYATLVTISDDEGAVIWVDRRKQPY